MSVKTGASALLSAPDRSARFLARLDAHLPTLKDNAARRSFLVQQLAGWEFRYERFVLSEGASEPVTNLSDPPQAADFLMTITAIAARREALREEG
jgi:hypothetical protein